MLGTHRNPPQYEGNNLPNLGTWWTRFEGDMRGMIRGAFSLNGHNNACANRFNDGGAAYATGIEDFWDQKLCARTYSIPKFVPTYHYAGGLSILMELRESMHAGTAAFGTATQNAAQELAYIQNVILPLQQ